MATPSTLGPARSSCPAPGLSLEAEAGGFRPEQAQDDHCPSWLIAPWVTECNVQKMKEKVLARNVQRFVKTLVLTLCWNSYC